MSFVGVSGTMGSSWLRRNPGAADAILVGLGNSILTDDSVGLRVAHRVAGILGPEDAVDVALNERGGMDVVDLITGYRRAVLVDAVKTGRLAAGSLVLLPQDALPQTRRLGGLHDLDLPSAMELARVMGMDWPDELVVLAVEVEDDLSFGEDCTPDVAAAIGPAALVARALCLGQPLPENVQVARVRGASESQVPSRQGGSNV